MDSAQGHQLAVENEGGGEEGRKAWRETGFRGRSGSKIVSGVCVSSDEVGLDARPRLASLSPFLFFSRCIYFIHFLSFSSTAPRSHFICV